MDTKLGRELTDAADLLERLQAVNPKRFRAVIRAITDIVEGQEVLAKAPTILRARAKYLHKRYLA